MDSAPVSWPDPRGSAPAAFARLAWGAGPAACGLTAKAAKAAKGATGATGARDEGATTWFELAADAGARCFGVPVACVALGFVLGALELVRVDLPVARSAGAGTFVGGVSLAGALAAAGYRPSDEHFWTCDLDATRAEVDLVDGHILLVELT